MPKSKFRDDINVIGVPLTEITNNEYSDPRQRQLFKNIIYLGALSALLDMDVEAVEKLIGEQYKGKEKLIAANVACAASRPRLGTGEPSLPDRAAVEGRRQGRRSHLHRGQRRRGARRGLWRRHGLRLVSDHAILVAGGGLREVLHAVAQDPETGRRNATPSCRPRMNSPRSAW
jgi:hypothetical protein